MTYVILPGRGAMIEYDDCHLSIMIIFEPYDYKSNNLIIRSHTTFDLPPPPGYHSSQLLPLHLGEGHQRLLCWLWREQPGEQSVQTWTWGGLVTRSILTPGTGGISFVCLLLTINYLWKQRHWVNQILVFPLTQDSTPLSYWEYPTLTRLY